MIFLFFFNQDSLFQINHTLITPLKPVLQKKIVPSNQMEATACFILVKGNKAGVGRHSTLPDLHHHRFYPVQLAIPLQFFYIITVKKELMKSRVSQGIVHIV